MRSQFLRLHIVYLIQSKIQCLLGCFARIEHYGGYYSSIICLTIDQIGEQIEKTINIDKKEREGKK